MKLLGLRPDGAQAKPRRRRGLRELFREVLDHQVRAPGQTRATARPEVAFWLLLMRQLLEHGDNLVVTCRNVKRPNDHKTDSDGGGSCGGILAMMSRRSGIWREADFAVSTRRRIASIIMGPVCVHPA
jgi:hypothetical protein